MSRLYRMLEPRDTKWYGRRVMSRNSKMSIVRHALFMLAVGLFLQANGLALNAGDGFLVGKADTVETAAAIRTACPVCYFLGFDCEGPVYCNQMSDGACSDLCRSYGTSHCQHPEWGKGWLSSCSDTTGFTCACAPPDPAP